MLFSSVRIFHSFHSSHILPCRVLNTFPEPRDPIMEFGIVYHVYTHKRCAENRRYITEVDRNSYYVKSSDKNAKIALITNCDVPESTAKSVDVIVPIHDNDVVPTSQKQWFTRVLYNAYLPFNYSFITDTHVFPCDNKSYSDILTKFKHSNIDISFSSRVNRGNYASGGAILSKFGKGSFLFWKLSYQYQVKKNIYDDQTPMTITMKTYRNKLFKFEWLSSNYFYASHGIKEDGVFSGPSLCYRSSIVVTGPIRWVHGKPSECELMNGKNRELVDQYRVYFTKGICNTTCTQTKVITSESELNKAVYPYKAPKLKWDHDENRSGYSLFWY